MTETQLAIDFTAPPPAGPHRFNGSDYDRERDDARLTGQLERIWNVMRDGGWRTLGAIAKATGDPEASISAQLRHLRKPRFGGHSIGKRHLGRGLYEYQLVPKGSA